MARQNPEGIIRPYPNNGSLLIRLPKSIADLVPVDENGRPLVRFKVTPVDEGIMLEVVEKIELELPAWAQPAQPVATTDWSVEAASDEEDAHDDPSDGE